MEYSFLCWPVKGPDDMAHIQSKINEHASQGWEVHTFTITGVQAFVLLQRRVC